jgi:tryptophan synthase beta chain
MISQLRRDGYVEAVDIDQLDTFKAAMLFAQTEGIIPAPESAHAIAAVIQEAEQAKIEGKQKTILFNLSGHGLIDMGAYDQYMAGELSNYTLSDEELEKTLQSVPKVL